ncbi:DVA-1 polyprotein [Orchesella cincta]|uniref:DVA-1 polyprotein n=1 Tax=Orchesella cincta TaxID=48709 RepID=A0A1D2MCR3_ORCCI|nr:DVA-1 polyprotein [Orchesella cincta]
MTILKTYPSGVEEGLGKEPQGEFSLPIPSSTKKEVRFSQAAEVKEFKTGSSCSSSDNSCTTSRVHSSSSPRVIYETLEDLNVSLLEESCNEYGPPSSIHNSSMDEAITTPSPPNGERPMALQRSRVPVDYFLMYSPVRALSLQIRDMSLGTTQVSSHSRQLQVHAADVVNESKDAYSGVSEQNLSSQQPSNKKSALSEPLEPIPEETSPQSTQSLNEIMASGNTLMPDSDSESVATVNEDDDIQVIPESPEFESSNNSDADATQTCDTLESSTSNTSTAERLSNIIQKFIDTHTDDSDPLEQYFFMKEIEKELAKLSEEDWNNILSSYADFFGDEYIKSILIHRSMYEGALSCRIRRMLYGPRYGLSINISEAH